MAGRRAQPGRKAKEGISYDETRRRKKKRKSSDRLSSQEVAKGKRVKGEGDSVLDEAKDVLHDENSAKDGEQQAPKETSKAPQDVLQLSKLPKDKNSINVDPKATTENGKSEHGQLETLYCEICEEQKERTDFPEKLSATANCAHRTVHCREWLQGYLHAQIEFGVTEARCPDLACEVVLAYDDLTPVTFPITDEASHDEAFKKRLLQALPGFIACPRPVCPAGHAHEDVEDAPIFTREVCRDKLCTSCNQPWPDHEGRTCEQYKEYLSREPERRKQDSQVEALIARTTRKCPKCNVNIEKNGGCNHMLCKRCGHEFCWQCLAQQQLIDDDGNHRHAEDCPLYRPLPQRFRINTTASPPPLLAPMLRTHPPDPGRNPLLE